MDKYVDLGVSFFDPDFTLNPQRYLADLYGRKEVLGFTSEGMNFLFRLQDCRQLMLDKSCARALESHADRTREAEYARKYPHRARHFELLYQLGDVDMSFKALIARLLTDVADQASFAPVEPIVRRLGDGGRLTNFVDDIALLPLRMFLDTCRLAYADAELLALHAAGMDFLKALENFSDEAVIARADRAIAVLNRYLDTACQDLDADSLVARYLSDGRGLGLSDERLKSNLAGNFLAALSNTAGISAAFILRTLVNDKIALSTLKARPELLQRDHVITELLRRDSHVKAMSRFVPEAIRLAHHTVERGESVLLFFPGINGDPAHWGEPARIDFNRSFSGDSNVVFGGGMFSCIGRKLALALLQRIVAGFVRYLPPGATIDDAAIEVDGSWVAERIIRKMPVQLS